MATNAEQAYEKFLAAVGQSEGTGEWFEVTQDQINQFADLTHDHQFIHVDPEMAAQLSPWGVTIAHGFLTLSMLTHLSGSIPQDMTRLAGIAMGVNYGFDKIRFINPVKVNSRIRATSVLKAVELRDPNNIQTTKTVTVEIEGEEKPACVADWITRLTYI
ncbi:MAG: MaoC family dehydratase [Microthrixaceae bacterium]|nr:MaoC family dehydratase [Acidimicrobiales bacterium]MCB9403814.1 MaoC family dehydratase [Microthrixaceae bacterium]